MMIWLVLATLATAYLLGMLLVFYVALLLEKGGRG